MMNIALIGYRGVGKSTLGCLLAKKLNMNFIDIDTFIESEIGMSIKNYFTEKGEQAFRVIEKQKIREILQKNSNSVIAFGGGVVQDKVNIITIRAHSHVLFLDLDEKTIFKRINNQMRPALTQLPLKEEIHETLGKRLLFYHQCADAKITLQKKSKKECLELLIKANHQRKTIFTSQRVNIKSKSLGNYNIEIKRGLFYEIPQRLTEKHTKYLLICDSNIRELFAQELKKQFEKQNKDCQILSFSAGERNKSLETFTSLQEQIGLSLDRKSCIIALGGGVTGDLAGFIAATYMRGISFVHVPTSLLAMVDSSIGGKLGVNTSKGKNCVGVFKHPEQVFIDPLFLHTLPEHFLCDGFAEVLKHAFIGSKQNLEFLMNNLENIFSLDSTILSKLLYESIKIKLSFVYGDEIEIGKRCILNFGHTLGHAFEEALGFEHLSHGHAVALGMLAAAKISNIRGLLKEKAFDLIRQAIVTFQLPCSFKELQLHINPELVYNFLAFDKKTIAGRTNFILLQDIGKSTIQNNISREEILEAIAYVS